MNKPKKILRICAEAVIDRKGNIVGNRPEDFPQLANVCKAVAETIRTGQDYRVVNS